MKSKVVLMMLNPEEWNQIGLLMILNPDKLNQIGLLMILNPGKWNQMFNFRIKILKWNPIQ